MGTKLSKHDHPSSLWPLLTLDQNSLPDGLSTFGFNMFIALVVDLLHEFELGVWHMLLVHLLWILFTLNKDLVHKLDRRWLICIQSRPTTLILTSDRYRQIPPFGPVTIRQFSANTSELSNLAAWNFEDLLQVCVWDKCHITLWTNLTLVFYPSVRRLTPQKSQQNCYGSSFSHDTLAWACQTPNALRPDLNNP
jgi:hypothetical protein